MPPQRVARYSDAAKAASNDVQTAEMADELKLEQDEGQLALTWSLLRARRRIPNAERVSTFSVAVPARLVSAAIASGSTADSVLAQRSG